MSRSSSPDSKRGRVRAEIVGDVQGVGFRLFIESHARRLGLHGWVRNSYDGAVEVEAEGAKPDLERLIEYLRQGPRAARVQEVRLRWSDYRGDLGPFGVRA